MKKIIKRVTSFREFALLLAVLALVAVSVTLAQTGKTFASREDESVATAGASEQPAPSIPNAPPNDKCANAQTLPLNQSVAGTIVSAVNDYELAPDSTCFSGLDQTSTTAAGRDVVYSFTAPTPGNYSFRVWNKVGPSNMVIYAATTCPAASGSPTNVSCARAANRNAVLSGEQMICLPLVAAGQHIFVFVDEAAMTDGGTFYVQVEYCARDPEPNNTPATAVVPGCPRDCAIGSVGDIDFFTLGSLTAGQRIFAMADGAAGPVSDIDMRVTTTTGTLEYDDANAAFPFGNLASVIAGTPAQDGNMFLRVNRQDNAETHEPYRVYSVAQSAIAVAIAESESNGMIGNADSNSTNYFKGALNGPAPSADVDMFVFTAAAGSLIFVALDGDPLRNNTPLDAALELLDSAGASLIKVDDSSSSSSTTSGAGSLTATTPFSPAEGLAFRAPATGKYYVRVTNESGSTMPWGAGDYLLSISKNCTRSGTVPALSAVSRKLHGANAFDIDLPLGNPGIECRTGGPGGDHKVIVTFANPVTVGDVTVVISSDGMATATRSVNNAVVTVDLHNVANAQNLLFKLVDVSDGVTTGDVFVSMRILLGDTTESGTVNASDIGQTKSKSGQAVTAANFRTDVTVSGSINSSDIGLVKSKSGTALP